MWASLCVLPPGPLNVRGNSYFGILSQIGFSFSQLLIFYKYNGKIKQRSERQNTDESAKPFCPKVSTLWSAV